MTILLKDKVFNGFSFKYKFAIIFFKFSFTDICKNVCRSWSKFFFTDFLTKIGSLVNYQKLSVDFYRNLLLVEFFNSWKSFFADSLIKIYIFTRFLSSLLVDFFIRFRIVHFCQTTCNTKYGKLFWKTEKKLLGKSSEQFMS